MSKILASCLLCLILFGLVACGGGGSTPAPTPTPTPTPVPSPTPAAPVSVSPTAFTVPLNGSQQLTAAGSATPVTWSVNSLPGGNTTVGTISPTGFYQAPSGFNPPGTISVTITATSIADATKTASSTANVVYPNKNNATETTIPIKLGSVGENLLDNNTANTECCVGTLGSLITRGTTHFILSNNHVLARSDLGVNGEAINQTRTCGGGTPVGSLAGHSVIKPTSNDATGCVQTTATLCGAAPDNVDAAIATANGNVDTAGTILELGAATTTDIGDLPPSSTLGTPAIGLAVAKSGRTTGLTCSSIEGLAGSVAVDYDSSCHGATAFQSHFKNQILVTGANFIESGDSGSLLVETNTARPVGLMYASGGTTAVANPITDVITVLNARTSTGLGLITGNPDHAVSCQQTQVVINSKPIPATSAQVSATAATLSTQQQQAAGMARDRHAVLLMRDQAVHAVTTGASADNPKEGAVVIELSAAPRQAIPAVIDGVRTRVVYSAGAVIDTSFSEQALQSTIAVKEAHVNEYFGKQGIRAVAVGRSNDNPAETAILIYTTTGVASPAIPPVIDGIRTRVIEGTPFHAR
jgi:predicted lactoylglutathione lyase